MRVKLFLTLVAFGLITLITYNVVEADASWDANSVKKVEVSLTSKVHINKMVLAFIANFAITLVGFSLLTKKVKSLEEQLEFQEKEKLDISTHLAEVESKYAESEKCWWAKEHDYGMCVKACDLMRTAACKLAFNILPFKGYLIECP